MQQDQWEIKVEYLKKLVLLKYLSTMDQIWKVIAFQKSNSEYYSKSFKLITNKRL